ncbi:MAG TPA: hypothetical protein VEA99_08185 [Gemmatimonadaceae bacterium]|nr:hypothetical protein [Gemmatimonadaceae bacterium]
MRRRLLRHGAAVMLGLSMTAACAPERDGPRADSSPDQAGRPVQPPAGATAAARPAPTLPETVAAKAGAPASAVRRPAPTSAAAARRAGDTLEYDRAIEYKPNPARELPAAKP